MEWYFYVLLIAGGFACGYINMLAGSGSLITLPILIFIGLPVTIANGTNRVAILFQNLVGVAGFRQNKMLGFRKNIPLLIPSILGALVGAQVAVNINEREMKIAIGGLMLVMLLTLLAKPRRWLEGRGGQIRTSGISQLIIFFLIGIYGGFIQAGSGIFLLAALVLSAGYDLKFANPVKILIIFVFTIPALIIFVFNSQVHWPAGLVLSLGNIIGAWVGTRTALKKDSEYIRVLLILVLIATAAKMFGLFDLIGKIIYS